VRSPTRSPRTAGDQGYILVALLLLVGAMASIGATFSRHVVVRAHTTSLNTSFLEAQEIADSQVEFVIQSDRAGIPVIGSKILEAVRSEAAHHDTTLAVATLANDRMRIGLQALPTDGMGVTRLIEVERIAAPKNLDPDTLPRLAATSLAALAADLTIPRTIYTSSATVSNTILEGLVIIQTGVALTLDNVIIRGAILSEGSLQTDPLGDFEPLAAPQLIVGGNVRILAGDDLPGLAILMPDGIISTTNADARVQIVGDTVAHDITLGCPGSLRGRLANVGAPVLHVDIEQIGAGRSALPWSPALDSHGAFDTVSIAFVPRSLTVDDLTALTDHTLPTVGAGP
jgi:hypothetical protein